LSISLSNHTSNNSAEYDSNNATHCFAQRATDRRPDLSAIVSSDDIAVKIAQSAADIGPIVDADSIALDYSFRGSKWAAIDLSCQ
jgi:hypothetical protein